MNNQVNDKRTDSRLPLYLNESALVDIRHKGGKITGSMVDLGSNGIGIGIREQLSWQIFKEGDVLEIQIRSGPTQVSWPLLCKVRHTYLHDSTDIPHLILGIQVSGSIAKAVPTSHKRLNKVYRCPDLVKPNAFCTDPIFFSETLHFQVTSIIASGFLGRTSRRNKTLFPGELLDLNIMIPNTGEFFTQVIIVDVRGDIEDERYKEVEFEFVGPSAALLCALGEFILTFSRDLDVTTLKEDGFFVDTIFRALKSTFASSESDWKDILSLRLTAFHSVGKSLDKKSPDEMRDRFDAFSRQVIVRSSGKVVGAGRMVFVGNNLDRSEHYALGLKIPKFLCEGGFLEFSRFCSDISFRGADIFTELMRQTFYIAARSPHKYILANCNPDLWNVYRRLGFRKIGKPFEAFGRKDCSLIFVSVEDLVFRGRRASLALWNHTVWPIEKEASTRLDRRRWRPWILINDLLAPAISHIRREKSYNSFKSRKK